MSPLTPGTERHTDAAAKTELPCRRQTGHEPHEWEDGWTRYLCPGLKLLVGKHPRKPGEGTVALHD